MNGGAFGTGVPWGVGAGVGGGPAGTAGVAGVGAGGLGMKPVACGGGTAGAGGVTGVGAALGMNPAMILLNISSK